MNRLHPELKRLIQLSRPANEPAPVLAPHGFSNRVVARWSTKEASSVFAVWQRAVWFAGWIAGGLIVGGAAWFLVEQQPATAAHDFVTVYQVLARSVVP